MSFEKVEIGPCQLIYGDCLEVMRTMPENSIDACVTDPPAGISFMNLIFDQDHGGREHWIRDMAVIFAEMLRVTKPGGHAFVWALPRTSHWTATALEDAGWVVREKCYHITAQGFPKSLNVSAAIDKHFGAKREVIGRKPIAYPDSGCWGIPNKNTMDSCSSSPNPMDRKNGVGISQNERNLITAPATDAAKQFSGFGTALKPAAEEWILVRKPLSEKTVAENVLRWSTGALNIDACRVPADWDNDPNKRGLGYGFMKKGALPTGSFNHSKEMRGQDTTKGRWPANLVFSHHPLCEQIGNGVEHYQCIDGCPIKELDEQSGELKTGGGRKTKNGPYLSTRTWHISKTPGTEEVYSPNVGYASRFFYCAKSSQAERGEGNTHSTVKPVSLLRYLARLICPPGGTILDPFFGSGSTGVAALADGFHAIGVEKERPYFDIACRRLEQAASQPDIFRSQPYKPIPQPETPKQEELWGIEP